MDINLVAVLAATAGQFIVGAIWYMPVFGGVWGKLHGFDKLTKVQQKAAQSKMAPWYVIQTLVTVMTAFVLAKLIVLLPDESSYMLATWVWFGFIVPTQVSGVIFGGTEEKNIPTKIAIQSFGSLACLLAAAFILGRF